MTQLLREGLGVAYKKVMWFAPREVRARGRGGEVVQPAETCKWSVWRETREREEMRLELLSNQKLTSMLCSPGRIRMISHDGVMEEEVEAKAEQGEQEEKGEKEPGEKIGQT